MAWGCDLSYDYVKVGGGRAGRRQLAAGAVCLDPASAKGAYRAALRVRWLAS